MALDFEQYRYDTLKGRWVKIREVLTYIYYCYYTLKRKRDYMVKGMHFCVIYLFLHLRIFS